MMTYKQARKPPTRESLQRRPVNLGFMKMYTISRFWLVEHDSEFVVIGSDRTIL